MRSECLHWLSWLAVLFNCMAEAARDVSAAVAGACVHQPLVLGCPAGHVIAVLGVAVRPTAACPAEVTADDFPTHSIINSQCSGLRSCNWTADDDQRRLIGWRHGRMEVQYSCFPEKPLTCGGRVNVSNLRGYLRSFGYPEYYHGATLCRWTLRAAAGRRIRFQLLDLSIAGAVPAGGQCAGDSLTVSGENGRLLLSRCAGDLPRPVVVDSSDAELVVTWSTRSAFQLRRGLLASYADVDPILKDGNASLIRIDQSSTDWNSWRSIDGVGVAAIGAVVALLAGNLAVLLVIAYLRRRQALDRDAAGAAAPARGYGSFLDRRG